MINVSNKVKQACNSDKLIYREYVVLKGTTTQIDVSTEMYATAYKDTHFIGSFNMKYIKFTTSNDVKYRNKELTLYKEVDGESFKIGNFIVTEIKDNDSNEEVSVTAYDYGLKFANPYITNLDYASGTITLKNVLDEICTNVGVELDDFYPLTNGDFIVDSNQFVNGEMFGDVVSAIAYLSGDFATINNDDKLELIFTKETNEIIEDYVDLQDKRDTQPITSVSIGLSQIEGENVVLKDNDLIEQYGEHWLIINDVPFAYTQQKRQQLITSIFNKVKGFGYSSFKSEYSFKPYYTLGDLIQFRNKEGNLVNSIILKFTSKYDNIILEAPSVTKATIEYQTPLDALEIAKRTEIIVDKQNQTITSLSEEVLDLVRTSSGGGIVTLENCQTGLLQTLKIIGEVIPNYPKNKLYPSNDFYTKPSEYYITNTYTINEEEHKEITKLPFDYLGRIESVYDEFNIDNQGRAYLVRRIGLDENGNQYVLDNEIVINYDDMAINLYEGTNVLSFNYYNPLMQVSYAIKNTLSDTFATNLRVNNQIKQARNEIELSVTEDINTATSSEQIISKINLTPGKINLEGTITANGNFKILKDGSIEANNGKFMGDIYLDENHKVIGGNGLFTNLQFVSGGSASGWDTLGFISSTGADQSNFIKKALAVEYYIPKNFTIQSAVLILQTTPTHTVINSGDGIGKCSNLKLYRSFGDETFNFFTAIDSDGFGYYNEYFGSEIPDGLGAEIYTPSNLNAGIVDTLEVPLNITYLETNGRGQLFVQTTDNNPTNYSEGNSKTGAGRIILNIFGYMKM